MIKINIKPVSVNQAWKGSRFKTKKYKDFEETFSLLLPKLEIPKGYLEIYFEFGLSAFILSDWDNPIKTAQDVISKKYGFNDNIIVKGIVKKVKVKKGQEYIKFNIKKYEE